MRDEVLAIGRRWAAEQRRLVTLVAALDVSAEWTVDGSRTCAHWVAEAVGVEVCTAREWLRIGHALRGLPVAERAWREGRISYSKVRALTRVACAEHEAELCALAERVPAAALVPALAAWLQGHETPEQTAERHRRARGLTSRLEPEGTVLVTARLAPLAGGVLLGAIDARVRRWRPERPEPPDASADASGAGPARWPSLAQQRADALVELVGGGGSTIETEIVVHVRGDGCALDDGTPVDDHTVARLLPRAFVRALVHDARGRPIDASDRRRHPNARQKRVVSERDRACVDCGGTDLLEYDHDPPFGATQRTVTDELELRCWTCHRRRHRGAAEPRLPP